jgi:hypothetical protein
VPLTSERRREPPRSARRPAAPRPSRAADFHAALGREGQHLVAADHQHIRETRTDVDRLGRRQHFRNLDRVFLVECPLRLERRAQCRFVDGGGHDVEDDAGLLEHRAPRAAL